MEKYANAFSYHFATFLLTISLFVTQRLIKAIEYIMAITL